MAALTIDPRTTNAPATAGMEDLVPLDPDHPGFRDPVYRARRNEIARISMTAVAGQPAPRVEYTDVEHEVWCTVWKHLVPVLERRACREFFEGMEIARLDRTRIPQLADVNAQIEPVAGFSLVPVAGLVTARSFLDFLGRRKFLSTQYIRHSSVPLYTPEPDVVHELVGHANVLAHPLFAELNSLAGQAAAKLSDEDMKKLENVYWYTLEFGAVKERGEVKAFGAGLLSSFGELGRFIEEARLRPMDLDVIATTSYDPTRYQDDIFVAESMDAAKQMLVDWFGRLIETGRV